MPEAPVVVNDEPNAAECYAQDSIVLFEFPGDCAGVRVSEVTPKATAPKEALDETSSDFPTDRRVEEIFQDRVPSSSPGPDWSYPLLSPGEAFLCQVHGDIEELSENVRASHEVQLCRQFAEGVGKQLAHIRLIRCAVFGDEEDGVELVAHSRASMRQVTFEFRPDENSINIVSIDEEMRRFEWTCAVDKVRTLAKAIAWLNPG